MGEEGFSLHPQLAADCVEISDLPLSRVLLSRDSNYPWVILVPKRAGITEIFQLSEYDQQQLLRESTALTRVMAQHFAADKMNVAALGNMVPQLHLHIIVRYRSDVAWPKPVWGVAAARPYEQKALENSVKTIKSLVAAIAI